MAVWGWILVAASGYIIGGCVLWLNKRWTDRGLSALLALSTGLLWAVALAGMLPHGWTEVSNPPVWILAGLLTAFVFQRGFGKRRDGTGETPGVIWGALIGMGIHAFFEGVALGAGFHADVRLGLAVLSGLVLHKIPEGMAIASLAMTDWRERRKAMGAAVILGLCTAAGAGTAWIVTGWTQTGTGIPLLFSAGILIYIAGAELWPAVNKQGSRRSIGWVLSGVLVYGLLGWGSHLLAPGHSHGHPLPEMSDSHSHAHQAHPVSPVEIPAGVPAPTVRLIVEPDAEAGWNIRLETSHFRFAPERVNEEHRTGEGHAHLYVDGRKVARLYGPWYHLGKLPPGTHTIRVELNSNDHAPYVFRGKNIGDQVTIQVKDNGE